MKRKNLFLTLISSILVTIAIVTVTVCSVINTRKNNNNVPDINNGNQAEQTTTNPDDKKPSADDAMNENERDGSAEKPYILYSAENFVTMIRTYGAESNHFELVNDIDFADKKVAELFTKKISFVGVIEGNGYSLKNITINVNADNLGKYTYLKNGYNYVRVSLFGTIGTGSEISNLKIENLNVTLADEVYEIVTAEDAKYSEVVVAGLATYAYGTKIDNVDFEATVNGFSIITKADSSKQILGKNAMGGLFAVTNNLTITNSNITSTININKGERTFVGGVAGYAFNSTISDTKVNTTYNTTASTEAGLALRLAGVAAHAKAINLTSDEVVLTINEVGERWADEYVESVKDNEVHSFNVIEAAGLIHSLYATEEKKSNITNVTVTSNVEFDCILAGFVMDTYGNSSINSEGYYTFYINVTDPCVEVNADVLAIHAMFRQMKTVFVKYNLEGVAEDYFNIKVTGDVRLNSYRRYKIVKIADVDVVEGSKYEVSETEDYETYCAYSTMTETAWFVLTEENDLIVYSGFTGNDLRVQISSSIYEVMKNNEFVDEYKNTTLFNKCYTVID